VVHFPKPFFRNDRKLWYVQIKGKQHNLGPDEKEAFHKYHQLMQMPEPVQSTLVVGIIDGFLEWTKQHRSPATYDWYQKHLQSFVSSLPDKQICTVQLKPFHVQQWVDAHPSWGDTYKRGAMTAVQRVFLWAEKIGHIDRSPIRHIEKPMAHRRDNPVTPEIYEEILTHVKDQNFRDLLDAAWESGARPQELCHIEARHVNLERKRIEIPPAEAKGKQWRLIYLTDRAASIIGRLAEQHPKGKLFKNTDGRPWTPYSIGCRFYRLKEKLGARYALYDLRHSFCQGLLEKGVDHLVVAALMGHKDGSMVSKVYSHMNRADDHLRDTLNRAR
jgi:integrase